MFSLEDKHLIKALQEAKKYSPQRLLKEFPDQGWKQSGLDKLLRKLDTHSYIECQKTTFTFYKVV